MFQKMKSKNKQTKPENVPKYTVLPLEESICMLILNNGVIILQH